MHQLVISLTYSTTVCGTRVNGNCKNREVVAGSVAFCVRGQVLGIPRDGMFQMMRELRAYE